MSSSSNSSNKNNANSSNNNANTTSSNKEEKLMYVSLGINPETGTCVRHPSIRIRLGASPSHCHYTTCRLCALDLLAAEAHLKDPQSPAQTNNSSSSNRNGHSNNSRNNHDDNDKEGEDNGPKVPDEEDEEPGDEDILDDDDEDDAKATHSSEAVALKIQQAILRVSQLHALSMIEKDELILSLQRQVATQDERILVLQATVDKQQKTITHELKVIKTIAKKRAQKGGGSIETSTTASTPETPSEQPPRLPGRQPSHPLSAGIHSHAGGGISTGTRSGLLVPTDSASSPSSASASSVPSLPQLPPPPSNTGAARMFTRPGPSLNNGTNTTPPILPQRMESMDTMTLSYTQSVDDPNRHSSLNTETANVYVSSAFSSLTSGAEMTSSTLTTPSQGFAASQYSQFVSSAVSIDTFTDLQKPPQRKPSARPKFTTVDMKESLSGSNSSGFSSHTDETSLKGDDDPSADQSLDPSVDPFRGSNHDPWQHQKPPPPPPQQQQEQPPPPPEQQAQEIAFFPTQREISFVPPPPATKETTPILRASKSIPNPIRQSAPEAFDGHATAPVGSFQQEIEFDATDYHRQHQQQYHQKPNSNHARTSIAQVRFDQSQQLLLEASQALHSPGIPTPSTRIRKSMTKKSMPPEQQQQQKSNHHEFGRSTSNPSIVTRPRTQSREIEFSVLPEPQKAKSVLERHLEGPSKSTNLGASMHNKTEEQIIQEKIYGKAAVAKPEDEDNDEYDNFDATSLDLPFTTNKGYLEYPKDGNLSPVSCLTTLSSAREFSQIENNNEEEDNGPRKALHSAGVARRLPMEDRFEADDDDDDNEQQATQDLSNGERGDNKSNSNNSSSSKERAKTPTEYKTDPDNGSWNSGPSSKISDSMPVYYEASQRDLRTDPRNLPNATSPFAASTKRASKPSLLVDDEIVQDKYGDQGKYTGYVAKDSRLPHGYGIMKYNNNRQYDGLWKEGRWHGDGKWVNPNGDRYEGKFDYDARHGRGIYTWKNGNVYRGEFFQDKRQGKGAFHFANGNVYEGDFMNGVFDGQGRYKFDGGSYEGEWKNGRYHGRGILLFADGSSYRGEFLDGVAHGQGEEKGADGTVRRGIWENGNPPAI